MVFTARYLPRRDKTLVEYYRTIAANGINEATRQAERWVRRGYICAGVMQRECAE